MINTPKTILITGASSGIGKALALHYADSGITLFISGRNSNRLNQVAEECRNKGATVNAKIIDVADKEQMERWINSAHNQSPLNLVIANAGISAGTGSGDEESDQAYQIFQTNVIGVINTVAPAIEIFKTQGDGQIALMGSMAGYFPMPGAPSYAASKAAVLRYAQAIRENYRGTIKVNLIIPGFVESRITDQNDFAMPFKISAERAAKIIVDGLKKNKGTIAFPWQMVLITSFLRLLPPSVIRWIMGQIPEKS